MKIGDKKLNNPISGKGFGENTTALQRNRVKLDIVLGPFCFTIFPDAFGRVKEVFKEVFARLNFRDSEFV